MNASDLLPHDKDGQATEPKSAAKHSVFVKELSEKDRRRILRHFLALKESDRLLRFGTYLPDEMITKYVEGIDFSRDKVFGVMSAHFRLVGVGHLAFAPRQPEDDITDKEKIAEFGVSVSESARGKGVGFKLFERGAIHCRNADVDTLYMHCLSSNQTMIHIAKKAGMEIHREYGEADAYLKLLPADAVSVLKEAMQEQVAALDYTIKANTRAAVKWLGNLSGTKDE
ncbi:GNAT family N-acetyltransferase [Undibacterium sp. Jales W-56]|uniref:GNAT family N-acetyltransferase n=1 Tax=Undibacterium sp. Jales W-56 TaxID=2897325 RepID=UPI0021D24F45|nr:GNAT family N-acetyltransferase [Undibacterium sp. Jales W-56]MCU6432232.1 GNAT family N-acetyltransferase [Undibacterium sp. Jales W-56]